MEDANQIANQANQGSVTFPVTVVVSFYLTEASNKQKVLLHKEKTRFSSFEYETYSFGNTQERCVRIL
jgi:hypothetical protein